MRTTLKRCPFSSLLRTQRNLRSGSMSMSSTASRTAELAQSADEGAILAARPLPSLSSLWASGPAIFASLAWIGFGVSCLAWEDLGDWSRTHELAFAAFVIAAIILVAAPNA